MSELDQLDVQVAQAVNTIRMMHNKAQDRLGLPRTRHERAEIGEGRGAVSQPVQQLRA